MKDAQNFVFTVDFYRGTVYGRALIQLHKDFNHIREWLLSAVSRRFGYQNPTYLTIPKKSSLIDEIMEGPKRVRGGPKRVRRRYAN